MPPRNSTRGAAHARVFQVARITEVAEAKLLKGTVG